MAGCFGYHDAHKDFSADPERLLPKIALHLMVARNNADPRKQRKITFADWLCRDSVAGCSICGPSR